MKYHYNFYQSQMRKDVNSSVFAKPCFEVVYNDIIYQVICKDKKILGITIVWYQVLGVRDDITASWIEGMRKVIVSKAKEYYRNARFLLSLYIQFGCTTPLACYAVTQYKSDSALLDQQIVVDLEKYTKRLRGLGLVPSSKHNLPDATIVIAVDSSLELLRGDISKNTKEKIKKAERELHDNLIKCGLTTDISDYHLFYELYAHTGRNKGFGAVGKRQWEKLVTHGLEHGYGKLFVVRSGDRVISGAFCLEDEDTLVYLYGGNDRTVGNRGYSQLLHWHIMQYAHSEGLRRYDMLGASRAGLVQDWLAQVTQFKMGFGGYKIEYLGSFDLVLHKFATWVYRMIAGR